MDTGSGSPLRILAPVALVVFGIAFLLILTSSGGGGGAGGASTAEKARDLGPPATTPTTAGTSGRLPQQFYVVKSGDTFASIAQKTGIPVARLQALNPNIDPQALVSGEKIKLR